MNIENAVVQVSGSLSHVIPIGNSLVVEDKKGNLSGN